MMILGFVWNGGWRGFTELVRLGLLFVVRVGEREPVGVKRGGEALEAWGCRFSNLGVVVIGVAFSMLSSKR